MGLPGLHRVFLLELVRCLLSVYDPSSLAQLNDQRSPDKHGFVVLWNTLTKLWVDWGVGSVATLQFLMLYRGSVRNWTWSHDALSDQDSKFMCGEEVAKRHAMGHYHKPREAEIRFGKCERVAGGVYATPILPLRLRAGRRLISSGSSRTPSDSSRRVPTVGDFTAEGAISAAAPNAATRNLPLASGALHSRKKAPPGALTRPRSSTVSVKAAP